MCWKHAGEPSEQIAVEAGYPSSMIVIEDQFAGVEITDEDVDQIELVGDLIRHIETMDNERRRPP
jgi:hypothetical protein